MCLFVCVCMCVFCNVHGHIRENMCVYLYIHAYIIHTYVYLPQVYVHACTQSSLLNALDRAKPHIYIYIYIYVYIYIYILHL